MPGTSLTTKKNSSVGIYFTPTRERRWELAYAREKFYLTDGEAKFFFDAIEKGKTIVRVRDLILTPRFLYMVPVKDSPDMFELVTEEIEVTDPWSGKKEIHERTVERRKDV